MQLHINTQSAAAKAIVSLAHHDGSAQMYIDTINRIVRAILFNQDEMGMDDHEVVDMLRILTLLRTDIEDISADKSLGDLIAKSCYDETIDPSLLDTSCDIDMHAEDNLAPVDVTHALANVTSRMIDMVDSMVDGDLSTAPAAVRDQGKSVADTVRSAYKELLKLGAALSTAANDCEADRQVPEEDIAE